LIDATQRVAGGDYANAATLYHEAIACCRQGGLTLEEAMVRIAFGGMCVAAGITDLAVKSYERAAAIAQAEQVWSLACQAWLGAGGAHRMRNNHREAAQAYETAATMAAQAELSILQIEALRLSASCHLAARQPAQARSGDDAKVFAPA
jgi:tetratricopeptide (TPR) repeat protein